MKICKAEHFHSAKIDMSRIGSVIPCLDSIDQFIAHCRPADIKDKRHLKTFNEFENDFRVLEEEVVLNLSQKIRFTRTVEYQSYIDLLIQKGSSLYFRMQSVSVQSSCPHLLSSVPPRVRHALDKALFSIMQELTDLLSNLALIRNVSRCKRFTWSYVGEWALKLKLTSS